MLTVYTCFGADVGRTGSQNKRSKTPLANEVTADEWTRRSLQSGTDRTHGSSRQSGGRYRPLGPFSNKTASGGGCREEACVKLRVSLCGIRTNEGSDLGVDDAAGEEVKVILHRVDHHCVSRVVAALRRRDRGRRRDTETERHETNGGSAALFGWAGRQAK